MAREGLGLRLSSICVAEEADEYREQHGQRCALMSANALAPGGQRADHDARAMPRTRSQRHRAALHARAGWRSR